MKTKWNFFDLNFFSPIFTAARRSPPASKKRQMSPPIAVEKRVARSPPNKRKRVSWSIPNNRSSESFAYKLIVLLPNYSHRHHLQYRVNQFHFQLPATICERKSDRALPVQVNMSLSLWIRSKLIRNWILTGSSDSSASESGTSYSSTSSSSSYGKAQNKSRSRDKVVSERKSNNKKGMNRCDATQTHPLYRFID